MSGGGGANPTGAQFPAPAVSGLWGQAESLANPLPYPNTGPAATNAYGDISSGWSNQAGTWNPQNQGLTGNSLMGASGGLIEAGSGMMGAGSDFLGQAGNQANIAGPGLAANVANANNLVAMMNPRITQTMNQGFDPQKKLFNQLFNQQQQQNLASQAAAGTANTPYGAGLTQQGNQNFDIAWQNAQLARQGQAAQNAQALANIPSTDYANAQALAGLPTAAAGIGNQLFSTGGNLAATGGNLASIGANLGMGAGNFLNSLNQQQLQDYLAYVNQSQSQGSNLMNNIINSLNAGTNLYGAQTGANLSQQQLNNQGLSGLGGLGASLIGSQLPNLFAGGAGAAGAVPGFIPAAAGAF